MGIRHLRYFLAFAEAGSFAEGAKLLRVAQPSLTRQIRVLESDVGCALFVRSWQGVHLTDVGEVLLKEATLAVAQLDLALRRTREHVQRPRKLVLGSARHDSGHGGRTDGTRVDYPGARFAGCLNRRSKQAASRSGSRAGKWQHRRCIRPSG
ncbi:LysR family transcriptional regulator [Paraburkholderia sp. CNPSo 3274]|uniref:LysR family transcriptional regulator n=1 Tax=Paraburkholderia sp. CNPSo 3274 TaxID=2940932 RepID=UPI0020B8099F|nr:LysR family transcriptional regulator [Paraburkholderia sp. CNPSo 3274]MCP3712679.1 LysR family transcriptional regulator [Paraburkholderia sp. CNPSo 3274]